MIYKILLVISFCTQASTPAKIPPPPSPTAVRATKARLEGRLEEAVALYRQALKLSPKWIEGWYFLGTIHYEKDQPRDCVRAMGEFVRLSPNVSGGYALLGLCLYQAEDFAGALTALNRAERLGLPRGEPITDSASYHAAILYTRDGNFEKALQILNFFSDRKVLDPKIIEATGIAALRRPIFPKDLPLDDRPLVYRIGRAVLTAGNRHIPEAVAQFAEIAADYPTTPNVHFIYGSLLISSDPDRGIEVLGKELSLDPGHLPSLVLLGVEYLRRGEPEKAIVLGEKAIATAPTNFTGHVVYGRALVESGKDLLQGIRTLELASRLEPTSPQIRIALASAYAKAGRREDAAVQRTEFQRLKKLLEDEAK